MLKLINSVPKDRYQEQQSFLPVTVIDLTFKKRRIERLIFHELFIFAYLKLVQ